VALCLFEHEQEQERGEPISQQPLASLESVRSFVKEYDRMNLPPLAGIVCNAGIQNVSTPTKTIDGHEATFGINHLAHYLLVRLLLPTIRPHGHIVFVSSGTHDPKEKTGVPEPRYTTARDIANDFELEQAAGQRRYTTSKLCNIYCTYELARRLAETSDERLKSIKVSAFDPGMMPGTGLARTYPAPLQFVWNYILPAATIFQRNVHRPAKSGERLAKLVSNSDALTSGKYYSDGQAKPSSPLSYSKENAIELWNTSAEMVGLSPDIATIQPELVSNPLKDLSAKECHG
jgi:NAD(P)-dependent dehydrogenase (short-subunit alcohol dehydrogenase family)